MRGQVPCPIFNDAPSYTTELDEVILKYEYNTNGQLTKEINPSGTSVSYAYDANGNLVSKKDEDGYITTNIYDSVNNLTQVEYDSSKTVSYTYNPNNQITSMTDWLGTNTYDLDVLGRINTVTDYEGKVTGYTWNSRNQKLSMTYPDESVVKYSYDIKGNLLKVLDGNGKETSYTYDALDRMTSEVLPNGVKTTKVYDALSRITGETSAKKDGTVIYSNSYSLDCEGNILSESKKTYENGNKLSTGTTEYLYDGNNQLIQIKDSEGVLEKYFYDTLGNRIQKEKTVPGNGNSNSTNNGNGNNKNKNNNNNNKSSTDITKYTYNNENQMLTLKGANEEIAGHFTNGELVTFTYDKRGNVRSITTDSGTIGQYYYDDTNKMTYSINKMGIKSGYTYDGAGRRVKETLEHLNINVPEKASIHVQTPIEDLLDSNQNIALDVKKEINYVIDSTTFDNRVLMVYGMQTKTQRYTYGNGVIGLDSWNDKATDWENIDQNKHDEQLYYVKDFRGSVLALTDYKCKITTRYDYNAFGTPIEKNHVNDQGIRSNIYHYAGYIYDYTTSLYFVNARYYMPETARFMAEDVYRGDGLNRYVYVSDNPLVYVDPMGLCGEGANSETLLQLQRDLEKYKREAAFWNTVVDILGWFEGVEQWLIENQDSIAKIPMFGFGFTLGQGLTCDYYLKDKQDVDAWQSRMLESTFNTTVSLGLMSAFGLTGSEKSVLEAYVKVDIKITGILTWIGDKINKVFGKGTSNTQKPYSNSRPSYGKGQVDDVWENAKDIDGKVYDPNIGEELTWEKSKPRSGQWDMGHTPENKYSDMHQKYINGEITKDEFLEWFRNHNNYRPESLSANRSHMYEK